jgi:hypothetical protein
VPPWCCTGAAYLGLYLLLDWASYVEPLAHTSITPWNPNTGVVMALLLARGAVWAPLVAAGPLSRTFLRHQGGDLWSEPSRLGGARFVIRVATHITAQTSL